MSGLDRRFAALADPTRRAILDRLGQGDATVNELRDLAPISQPALSRHLKVLEMAGLVDTRIVGTTRPRHLRADAFAEIGDWLAQLQEVAEQNFRRLDALLSDLAEDDGPDPQSADPRETT